MRSGKIEVAETLHGGPQTEIYTYPTPSMRDAARKAVDNVLDALCADADVHTGSDDRFVNPYVFYVVYK